MEAPPYMYHHHLEYFSFLTVLSLHPFHVWLHFTRALGLGTDRTGWGTGNRSQENASLMIDCEEGGNCVPVLLLQKFALALTLAIRAHATCILCLAVNGGGCVDGLGTDRHAQDRRIHLCCKKPRHHHTVCTQSLQSINHLLPLHHPLESRQTKPNRTSTPLTPT